VQRSPDLWAREDDLDEIAEKRQAAWAPRWTVPTAEDTTKPRTVTPRLRAPRRGGHRRRNRRVVREGDSLAQDDIIKTLVPDAIELVETEG
jgi:hypothetical protein